MEKLTLREVFTLAPGTKELVDGIAGHVGEYPSVWHAYEACKQGTEHLVGWDAREKKLATQEAYGLLNGYILDRLGL